MTRPIIKTSSWFAILPDDHIRIGISRGVPRGIAGGYRRYTKLNPGPWFKSCASPEEYRRRYYTEILDRLDPHQTVREIVDLASGSVPVLVCFEGNGPTDGWCHRALVSTWLKDTIDLDVFELNREHAGCGWSHPKLSPALWRPLSARTLPAVPDRSSDINPYINRLFRHNGRPYQVLGVHPVHKDHAIVFDGKRKITIHADILLKYINA